MMTLKIVSLLDYRYMIHEQRLFNQNEQEEDLGLQGAKEFIKAPYLYKIEGTERNRSDQRQS